MQVDGDGGDMLQNKEWTSYRRMGASFYRNGFYMQRGREYRISLSIIGLLFKTLLFFINVQDSRVREKERQKAKDSLEDQ